MFWKFQGLSIRQPSGAALSLPAVKGEPAVPLRGIRGVWEGKPAGGIDLEMRESDFFSSARFSGSTFQHDQTVEPESVPPTRQPSVISYIASGKASWPAHTICPESGEGKMW